MDLKNLSPKELLALIANANAQMHDAHAAQVQSVKQKIEALLRNSGLVLNDVYPARAKKASGKKGAKGAKGAVAPKYRHPSDPTKTWSGRGRQPAWFAKAMKRRGATVDSLLIGGDATPAAPVAKSESPAKRVASARKTGKSASRKVAKRAGRKVTAPANA
ncbi:MAG: H-NS histone family protein [Rhodanobacter sp.]